MMKFDDLLAEVNGFGRFQFRLMLMLVIPRLILPFHFLQNNFVAFIPSHHCNINAFDEEDVFRDLSSEEKLIVSIPVEEDGSFSSCQMFAEPQYHLLLNSSKTPVFPTVHCQNGWVYDASIMKSTLATEWDLVCERKRLNKSTATIFFLGVMFGAAVIGHLSDRFGRKIMLLVSFLITSIFGFASALSSSYVMLAVMRFLTGFGASGVSIVGVVLTIEWADIKHRSSLLILLSMDWSIGSVLLGAFAYLVNDWRYLMAVSTIPLLPALIYWWWIPESARWLVSQGKIDPAYLYLSKCAEVNGRKQFMDDLKPEDLLKITALENENKKYSLLDLVRTPKLRRLTAIAGTVWFGVACSYYGISLNISGFGLNIFVTQLIYGFIEVPAKMFCLFSINKFGRKFNQSGGLLLTGLCLFCNVIIPPDMAAFQTSVAAMGKMFAEAAFTVLYLYTTELYPTVLRQNGFGFCSFLARLGVAVSPLVALLDEVWVGLPRLLFSMMAFGVGLLTILLPETNNTRLPETIEDVEQNQTPHLPRMLHHNFCGCYETAKKTSEEQFS
ncbi:solute carrier family 22 member 7-like isoform X3 [Hippocampus zosterae]|uniref:solute carrier family 22 member 7-like isoform X3 n=1 Tax=Hippocampus zosterae TaxID=109293 RepID=UPI00223D4EA4|nr:solute carrier family 22 member 7-like isoform X3 [Hippocampus zosterae]